MNVTRVIFSAAAIQSRQGRAVIELCCAESALPQHVRVRKRLKRRFKASLMRVLNFAKHETLRKLHRYLHANRELKGQQHPGASQVAFNAEELVQDLQSMLYSEIPQMLNASVETTLQSVGSLLPYSLPSQDVLDFISRRANLLSGVPNEIFQTIMGHLSEGLAAGESLADLSNRIVQAFNDIEEGRADVIAETETAAAFSFASDKAARAAGVEYKQWLHGGSKVPRPDHLAIDGLIVPIEEPYPVGAPPLMYPHAPDGSPEDVINCSCVSIPASASAYEGQ